MLLADLGADVVRIDRSGNVTLPYVVALANKGWKQACIDDRALALGLNVQDGEITYEAVPEAFELPYTPLAEVLG